MFRRVETDRGRCEQVTICHRSFSSVYAYTVVAMNDRPPRNTESFFFQSLFHSWHTQCECACVCVWQSQWMIKCRHSGYYSLQTVSISVSLRKQQLLLLGPIWRTWHTDVFDTKFDFSCAILCLLDSIAITVLYALTVCFDQRKVQV